eukprot:TRINITY_DN15095_c0_g1_i2.p1 TRINITY_DN15095_c0_g1~~TRINITY_DN15095_c0_g1_i2.p1  ORF type:complete len:170 (-),score=39.63 TRINITY_DN15095_c0_g1_i2:38-547(-)
MSLGSCNEEHLLPNEGREIRRKCNICGPQLTSPTRLNVHPPSELDSMELGSQEEEKAPVELVAVAQEEEPPLEENKEEPRAQARSVVSNIYSEVKVENEEVKLEFPKDAHPDNNELVNEEINAQPLNVQESEKLPNETQNSKADALSDDDESMRAVSYTHLTLPTICSV